MTYYPGQQCPPSPPADTNCHQFHHSRPRKNIWNEPLSLECGDDPNEPAEEAEE